MNKVYWKRRWRLLIIGGLLLVSSIFFARLQPLHAATETPTPAVPTPGGWIVPPDKPKATPTVKLEPNLHILRHYTLPERPQAKKRFTLFVEIQNTGGAAAEGWFVDSPQCTRETGPEAIDPCMQSLPFLAPGASTTVSFRLAYENTGMKQLPLDMLPQHSLDSLVAGESRFRRQVPVFVYPADPTPTPAWVFAHPKPDIFVRNWWTARAGATGDELFHSVSVTDTKPFELVLDLQNLGQTDAHNIRLDFCSKGVDKIQPAGAGCHQSIPTSLRPGEHANATQTLAFKSDVDAVVRYTFVITYEHRYEGQLYTRSEDETIYINRVVPQKEVEDNAADHSTGKSSHRAVELDATGPYLTVETDALNIRSGPGTAYPVIGATSQGRRFRPLGRNGDGSWWQIDVDGNPGWVYAGLVQAVGAQNIAVAQNIPPIPATPAAQLAQNPPSQAPAENLSTDGAEVSETVYTVAGGVPRQPPSAPIPAPAAERRGAGPLLVVDSYQTQPGRIDPAQPFHLQVSLRNVGDETANRVVVRVGGDQAVPIGSGAVSVMAPLTPGERGLLVRQLVLIQPSTQAVIPVSIQLEYVDDQGTVTIRQEEIGLMTMPATIAAGDRVATAPQTGSRPLWARLVFGLLGLGAGPK